MARNMLSAEELHEMFTAGGGFSAKGGQKDYCPDGSWLYKTKLQNFYEDRRKLLQHERVRVLGSLIQGEWLASEGRVKLEKQGKFSKSMGYAENGEHYLLPEEAMFLLDQGVVQIHHGGVPVSIQEALTLFLVPPVSVEQYQVFAHFTRLGYILRRYTGPITYEDQIGLGHCKKSMASKRKVNSSRNVTQTDADSDVALKKAKVAVVADEAVSDRLEERCIEQAVEHTEVTPQHDKDATTTSHFCTGNPDRLGSPSISVTSICDNVVKPVTSVENSDKVQFVCLHCREICVTSECTEVGERFGVCHKCASCDREDMEYKSVRDDVGLKSDTDIEAHGDTINSQFDTDTYTDEETDGYQSMQYSNWDFKALDFPDISGQQSEDFRFAAKSDQYLPPGLQLSERSYNVSIRKLHRTGRTKDNSLEFSHGSAGLICKLTAKNWSEYKYQMSTRCEEDILLTSPVGHLWKGEVTPLIKPHQSTSTRDILDRLKVIQNSNFSHTKQSLKPHSEEHELPKLVYDGYLPSSKFKKTKPGQPQFRLVIASQRLRVPDLRTLTSVTTGSLQEQVPVYWAVVECGDIIFFSFNDFDLPQDIAME